MTGGFVPGRRGRIIGVFTAPEAEMLRNLVSQVVELVRDESPEPHASEDPLEALLDLQGPISAPEDPVLARLLPDAYGDDEEASGEFRRFTERSLRDQKAEHGRQVIDDLLAGGLHPEEVDDDATVVEVELDARRSEAWLKCLTDVRLALATRLGVEEGDDEYWDSLPADDPRTYVHDIYDWLGLVQETLVQALS